MTQGVLASSKKCQGNDFISEFSAKVGRADSLNLVKHTLKEVAQILE